MNSEVSNNIEQLSVEKEDETTRCSAISARYSLAILGFLGLFNAYAMRVNLSVALVVMVITVKNDEKVETACPQLISSQSNQTSSTNSQGEFNWDSNTQSSILSAFFYGYIITQIPGGFAVKRFGGKWLFALGILSTSIFTLLTPLAARTGSGYLIALRFLLGLGEGVTYPAVMSMVGIWVPKTDRSRITTIVYLGKPMGTVLALVASGYLAGSKYLGGWPSVFYFFGTVGCIWFIAWAFLIYENPEDHPCMSKRELLLIQGSRTSKKQSAIPWRSILTSGPVWIATLTHFGEAWGFYTLLTEMPTYLYNILHFDIEKNGGLSSLPYITQTIFAGLASIVADKMVEKNCVRITTNRKIMNSIGFFLPGVCILAVGFVGCSPMTIMVLLCAAMGINGVSYSGFKVVHVDMSPEHTGTIHGISYCFASFAAILATLVVGKIVKRGQTLHNWSIVFDICAAIYFFMGTLFLLFGTADVQPWDNLEANHTETPDADDSEKKETSISNPHTHFYN